MQHPISSKPISSPAVRQKPETPEQWATLTEAWFVACEYEPTVENFRLLAEFLFLFFATPYLLSRYTNRFPNSRWVHAARWSYRMSQTQAAETIDEPPVYALRSEERRV